MMQMYVKDCGEAMKMYLEAFDGKMQCDHRNPDNTVAHAEMMVLGQVLAFCDQPGEVAVGNTMQFCFHLEEGNETAVRKAYDVLKDGAAVDFPLGSCEWSDCVFGLVDKYGINWCVFC